MNIGEQATVLAHRHDRAYVLAQADAVLRRVLDINVDELIPGRDAAWLVAAAMKRQAINGSGPRIVTRVMDDGLESDDRMG